MKIANKLICKMRIKTTTIFLIVLFLLMTNVVARTQNGHLYWNSRYSSYGISYPQWNGFWFDGYQSVDVTRQTSSTCKIVENALNCFSGTTL